MKKGDVFASPSLPGLLIVGFVKNINHVF